MQMHHHRHRYAVQSVSDSVSTVTRLQDIPLPPTQPQMDNVNTASGNTADTGNILPLFSSAGIGDQTPLQDEEEDGTPFDLSRETLDRHLGTDLDIMPQLQVPQP